VVTTLEFCSGAFCCGRAIWVSNFDQTPTAKEHMTILGRRYRRVPMPITDQYWQYAKEALLSACDAKADDDRQGLLELARTWTLAALVQRQSINRASPTEVWPV
jgi:hypothetical protein